MKTLFALAAALTLATSAASAAEPRTLPRRSSSFWARRRPRRRWGQTASNRC